MTYRPPTLTQDDKQRLLNHTHYRFSDILNGKSSAIFGPVAQTLANDAELRKFLIPGLKLAETNDDHAHAIGSGRTIWILDPEDEDTGIWGINVVSDFDVRSAQQVGAPLWTGFFYKIGKIPTPEAMKKRYGDRDYPPGFRAKFEQYYPPTDKAKEEGEAQPPPVIQPIERPTYEMTVIDNDIIVAKTAEESAADESHRGVPLAGIGAWKKFMGKKTPKDFGLPRAILAFQEDSGEVTPAVDEYESVKLAAQQGDRGAQEAMRYLGLSF